MKKPVMLMILDGLGLRDEIEGNGVKQADMKNLQYYMSNYPNTILKASGEAVGLPEGQMGNSEVGHLNIGAGRVVYQELTRISKDIREDQLKDNPRLKDLITHVKSKGQKLHLLGLLSDGGVHSHNKHLYELLKIAKEQGLKKVYIHCFLDGRDTPPKSAKDYIRELEEKIQEIGVGEIATVAGRYYAMDRDLRWERTERAYQALVYGVGKNVEDPENAVIEAYEEGITDEFMHPLVVSNIDGTIEKNDGLLFFNFRADRVRQMTRALTEDQFNEFPVAKDLNLHYVTMTQYDKNFASVPVLYPPAKLDNTLGEYLSRHNLAQLRIAETEKYAHVTYFFNGGVEKENPKEDRVMIPSPKVATYDMNPEMSAEAVTNKLLEKLENNPYDFIVINYANPDMVGHTGDMQALIKALKTVDREMYRIVQRVLEIEGTVLMTADHGNAEEMYDYKEQKPVTAHTTNNVPLILIQNHPKHLNDFGSLCDLAPTILELLELSKPPEMKGSSLIRK
ncbi:2,3-bisphosphoglycerate-independent phosphoglycerate mutase [Isachenkonia alkalipeptolytica]|uniref:2,3-bisphosphoglycerate-independent phosphoglycerate mutase n=1 Tax=Isachenkonia alkalipeptolytica TaxID=2565777 RepID=A0AA43XNV9_9CLOT|nr:2,3-bisphosphoglycerate-independent phosphoglycerate mutase [Isachenkonia alkalipeptolytica]NBG89195.1 2,3-bisphosphoglycerate-independent phosphoglycerate mutase [Isachenkonia alkalipeptolytica]